MTDQVTFESLGLSEDVLKALTKKGFKEPTPVQALTIPLLLSGEKDIIAQAQTGTGKTAAFGLPIIERITPGLRKVQAIVVAPTRELASQVAEELESLKAGRDIQILPVYGGQGMDIQLRQLKKGVDIVVATPGRAIDHLKRKTLKLDSVQFVVLDEADEMLQMGFIEDIEEILSHCQEDRRMLLFSATMPTRIKKLAEKFMGGYDTVKVKSEQESAENVEQIYYNVYDRDKLRALRRLIDTEPEFYALVFCRTRAGSDRLAEKLNSAGFDVEALHGEVSQAQRERILAKFKKGHANILIATDVAARGIDINDLTHVLNFDLPDSPEAYVHRIGRTGRAGKTGKAISFVAPKDRYKIRQIQKITKAEITKKTFPYGNQVLELKKKAMIERVFESVEEEIPQEYYDLAQEILTTGKPKQTLAAVLRMHFGSKLNLNSFPEISDPESNSSRSSSISSSRSSTRRRSSSLPPSLSRHMGGGRDRNKKRRDRDDRPRRSDGENSNSRTEGKGQEEKKNKFSKPEGGKKPFKKKFGKPDQAENSGKPERAKRKFKKKKSKIKMFD